MRVLIACEESQRVCSAFREKGHEAYSADILEPSGGHPEWHIIGDVIPLLNGYCTFKTMDGTEHKLHEKWDMIIAFPPCTHLAVSGAAWFEAKRKDGRQRDGIEFFCKFLNANSDRIVIENPIGIISGNYVSEYFPDLAELYGLPKKPTQIIQPYYFGDPFEKKTCLWIKGLPELVPTNIVDYGKRVYFDSGKSMPKWYSDLWRLSPSERSKARSRTFPGVAKAMAEQWG